MKKNILFIYIALTTLLFISRVVLFAGQFGGVEHDSGWYLGVARNLAERGIYASYTNTITYEKEGSYPSLHGRFSVQDKEGFSYFPAGVTVGPGYVIPQAILMKIFGYGFWQMRLWPLAAFAGGLLLLFYFTFKLGGAVSLFIFQVWLWLLPQIYIPGAYEAFGEHISLFYLLLSFFIFLQKKERPRYGNLLMFASGIAFSLAVLTKYLTLLAGVSFAAVFLYELVLIAQKKLKWKTTVSWIFWAAGFVLPVILFEAYRYFTLVSQFGIEGWQAANKDFEIHFKANGSGISLKNIDTEFVRKKFLIWRKVGFTYALTPWVLVVCYLVRYLKSRKYNETVLFLLVFFSSLSGLAWFVIFSPTGWTRHVWLSLLLGLAVISSLVGGIYQAFRGKLKFIYAGFLIIALALILRRDIAYPQFIFDDTTIVKWEEGRYEEGLQGLPTNTIPSLRDQKEAKRFFDEHVKPEDRVYYLGWFLVAELSPLVDKVFYSYDRYEYLERKNPQGGLSYLIIGPYQKGELSLTSTSYYINKVETLCERVVINNPSYTLCTLRSDVNYQNKAYE